MTTKLLQLLGHAEIGALVGRLGERLRPRQEEKGAVLCEKVFPPFPNACRLAVYTEWQKCYVALS